SARGIDLDLPVSVTLAEESVANAILLARVIGHADGKVLDALQEDARRAAAVNHVAVRVGLTIDEKRRPDKPKELRGRVEAQADRAGDFPEPYLRDESEIGAKALAEIVEKDSGVVFFFRPVPVGVKSMRGRGLPIPCLRQIGTIRILRAAEEQLAGD